jgi:hypothetical protein
MTPQDLRHGQGGRASERMRGRSAYLVMHWTMIFFSSSGAISVDLFTQRYACDGRALS